MRLSDNADVELAAVIELVRDLVDEGGKVTKDADEEADVERQRILVWLTILRAQNRSEFFRMYFKLVRALIQDGSALNCRPMAPI